MSEERQGQVAEVTTQLEVEDLQGWVIIKMRQPNGDVIYTRYEPQTALQIADAIGKASYQAKYGKPRELVVSLADQVIEQKRIRLTQRCNIMIKSMLADGKSNQEIVERLVDQVMAEVL
jgi:hypothetical protein